MESPSEQRLFKLFLQGTMMVALTIVTTLTVLALQGRSSTNGTTVNLPEVTFAKKSDRESEYRTAAEARVLPALIPIFERRHVGTYDVTKARAVALAITSDGWLMGPDGVFTDASVLLPNGSVVSPREIIRDQVAGVVFAKVAAADLPVIRFSSSAPLIGESLFLVQPSKIQPSAYLGPYRPLTAPVWATQFRSFYELPMTTGIEGSALVRGDEVVGLMTRRLAPREVAIPFFHFAPAVNNFLKTKKIQHPKLEIQILDFSIDRSGVANAPLRGALVKTVKWNSLAEKAGIKVGDVIIAVEGDQLGESKPLAETLEAYDLSARLKLEILRGKKTIFIEVPIS